MNFLKTALATTAIAASFGASAQVTGSLGGGNAPFLSLSAPQACTAVTPCTLGLGVATIVGGTTYIADQPFADMPAGFVFEDRFLAAGPTSSQPSTMTFSGGGRDYISFLWGSPETHNQLTVNSTAGSQLFTAVALGLALGDGSFYV
ncbi:MAG TPA: hypothetical protein VNG69_19060 [Casimicrobiaceae bacterium]|nr:hypothetical protein [Casimicrobiaceae bacterium]